MNPDHLSVIPVAIDELIQNVRFEATNQTIAISSATIHATKRTAWNMNGVTQYTYSGMATTPEGVEFAVTASTKNRKQKPSTLPWRWVVGCVIPETLKSDLIK